MYRQVAGVCLLVFAQTALAVDGSSLEVGYGEGTRLVRATALWNWDKHWEVSDNWTATGFWEADVGNWHGERSEGRNLWEVGLTPAFRLYSKHSGFFWEAGIGLHYMSHSRIDGNRVFGNHFNFGDHIGFGWRLGDHGQYELGYRFQHLSNANTATPNAGINFSTIRFGYNY